MQKSDVLDSLTGHPVVICWGREGSSLESILLDPDTPGVVVAGILESCSDGRRHRVVGESGGCYALFYVSDLHVVVPGGDFGLPVVAILGLSAPPLPKTEAQYLN